MTIIAFTKVSMPYGWLGNMSPHPVRFGVEYGFPYPATILEGSSFRTAEAAFQVSRLPLDHPARETIMAAKSPFAAKLAVKPFRKDFVIEPCSEDDVYNMRLVLMAKLACNPELVRELRATGDATIVEDCTKRPGANGLFWGAASINGGWKGKNMLGLLWMDIRKELAQ